MQAYGMRKPQLSSYFLEATFYCFRNRNLRLPPKAIKTPPASERAQRQQADAGEPKRVKPGHQDGSVTGDPELTASHRRRGERKRIGNGDMQRSDLRSYDGLRA